jgi:hypothetical protein
VACESVRVNMGLGLEKAENSQCKESFFCRFYSIRFVVFQSDLNHQVHKSGNLITLTYCTTFSCYSIVLKKRKFLWACFSSSQRFVDVCEGRVPRENMTLMKDISLKGTNAVGQYLYYKLQDIFWDEVLSKYILHPKVCWKMNPAWNCYFLWDYITRS